MSHRIPLLIAAAIAFLTFFLHVFGGGPEFLTPALASDLTADGKALYAVLWHMVSAFMLISVASFALGVWRPDIGSGAVLAVTALNIAIIGLFLFYGMTRLGSPWPLPQWIIFAVLSGLALWGLALHRRSPHLPA